MQNLIDGFASLIRLPGDALREAVVAIPLWAAKGIFLFYPLILLIWIYSMRESEVKGELPGAKKIIDLRPYAAASLIMQIVIYAIF
ncbi:MAG: hypothetical protein AB1656_20825 [Candidatus Omnitrophota bacterium]